MNMLINYALSFFLNILNFLTKKRFLAEISGVALNDSSCSVTYANDIFQHDPQNQHIPKPWVSPSKTDVASLIVFPELLRG